MNARKGLGRGDWRRAVSGVVLGTLVCTGTAIGAGHEMLVANYATNDIRGLNVWSTGDAIHSAWPDDLLSGLQRTRKGGNSNFSGSPSENWMLIDLTHATLTESSNQPGDTELCPGAVNPDEIYK